jgi:hypothetical protein
MTTEISPAFTLTPIMCNTQSSHYAGIGTDTVVLTIEAKETKLTMPPGGHIPPLAVAFQAVGLWNKGTGPWLFSAK